MSGAGRRHGGTARFAIPLVVVLLMAAWPSLSHAQVFESVGVRALGMGGAFVAVADDATANYWNPAGLSTVFFSALAEGQRLDTRSDPDPFGDERVAGRSTLVALGVPNQGATYYRLRSWQIDRQRAGSGPEARESALLTSLVTHHVGFSLVRPLAPGVVIGTVVKAVRGSAAMGSFDGMAPVGVLLDRASQLPGEAATRFDLDIGVMAGAGAVRVALVGRNLREPDFATPDGSVISLARQFRAGLSLRPTASLVVAVDADLTTIDTPTGPRRAIAFGAEQRLDWVAVRIGGRFNVEAEALSPVGALGFSLEVVTGLWLDAQVTGGRDVGDRGWGLSTRFGL